MTEEATSLVTLDDAKNAPFSLSPPALSEVEITSRYFELSERLHRVADENFSLKEENSRLRREKATSEKLDELIKPFSANAFRFMCTYGVVVGAALFLNSFGFFINPISDGVMQFLVGSTAATVISLVGMVLTGVFVSRPK